MVTCAASSCCCRKPGRVQSRPGGEPTRLDRAGHRARLLAGFAVLCLAAVACGGHPAPAPGGSAAPEKSPVIRSCAVDGLRARCGTLTVPQDRVTGQGPTIPVRFVVIPATGPDKAPDPVVYFAGGPGNSAVTMISSELNVIANLASHRDLVFIEQRGTGSSDQLTCPSFPTALAGQAALRASVESCLAGIRSDLPFYTTAMYADDVNQLLGDLHYATVNLMGISYGTVAEQVFLLRHPGRVRTMTLQSGFPLYIRPLERAPEDAQLALDYVVARCDDDAACRRAFPHLAADWAALWASAGTSPGVLPVSQSPTGTTVRLDQNTLAFWIYQALFAGDEQLVPAMISTLATATDKAAALVSVIRTLQASDLPVPLGGYPTEMMQYAIYCGEPWATQSPAALSGQRDSFAYQMYAQQAQWFGYVCPLIPKAAAALGDEQLTLSHVPVLAFNGAGDPIAPARNMAGVQRFWPDFREIVLPGQGHNVIPASWGRCGGPLTETFIEQASVAHLNTSCLAGTPAPPFVFNLTGVAGAG
jgi:pimeloyl-ACP methyl ester carboxylesterase